jgi:hypothetical protein
MLMMTRELVGRQIRPDGILYVAGENAVPFLGAVQSAYVKALQERARWLVRHLGAMPDNEFRAVLRQFFDRWVEEFQSVERSMGTES